MKSYPKMKSALLISTYNWPEALKLVLKSVLNQTKSVDEIIIADDGSGEETRLVINDFKLISNVPVKHVWQNDQGFRKAKILNKAIASSIADYIIEVDGDCVLNKNFVKDHLRMSERKVFLYGSRVNILEKFVSSVLKCQKTNFSFLSKEIKNRTRTIRIPLLSKFYKKRTNLSKKLRGCNISFWREDLIAVNGYNEDFEGWGREDSELFLRILNLGVKGRRLRFGGIVYHIWHKEKSKSKISVNNRIEKQTLSNKLLMCKNGIDKYL